MQINRLFEIIYLLLQKEKITATELANKFEVSSRTIYRDIETLSSAGIPIYMTKGKGGGISLLPDFVLDKTVLTGEEKENIFASLMAVEAVDLNSKNTALEKFRSLFGETYVDWIEVDFSSWYNCSEETAIFQTLKTVICSKKTVVFGYSNARGEESFRIVEPLKLCFKGGAWYLYAYCKTRCDFRFFKLRRIKKLEISNEVVEHKAPKRILTSEKNFQEEYLHLKLRLSNEMAYRVYEEFEKYEKQSDGSFIAEIDFPKGKWMLYYIITFGSCCEVLEPISVREEVKMELNKMLEFYK